METVQPTVLMSIYNGTPKAELDASLLSLAQQTRRCPVVLVVDGPLSWELDGSGTEALGADLRTVPLPKNVGLAAALNAGLKHVQTNFVMRMDADDIALPHRSQVQIDYASKHDSVFVCSWHEEFGERTAIKKTPSDPNDLAKKLLMRNAISHPTILIATSLLREVGGYREDAFLMEDYDLYLRLRSRGVRLDCIPETLVMVRVAGQTNRRAGLTYLRNEAKLRTRWHREGLVPLPQNVLSFAIHSAFRLAPHWLRTRMYKTVRD